MNITGKLIKELGYKPAEWWRRAITDARETNFRDLVEIRIFLDDYLTPAMLLRLPGTGPDYGINIEAENDAELENIEAVKRHMNELMRLPTVVSGAIMPDACPADKKLGVIPVGGVIATKNAIHPGMHSADICCSMAISYFPKDTNPTAILDAGMKLSHFGPGGRPYSYDMRPSTDLLDEFERNPFLSMLSGVATKHFGTQGDGNHFFFVGRSRTSEEVALVTHHGSRKPGAELYKRGMAAAEKYRRKLSPDTPAHNAWIPVDTVDGDLYWNALQLIRRWTKGSHFAIHDTVAKHLGLRVKNRFWNEHNFVFERNGLFYHGKGATPAWDYFAADSTGATLIPLNMAQPILVVEGLDDPNALGFSPHGAGRNFSRTAFNRMNEGKTPEEMIAEQAPGIDVRYFNGKPDISELPGAYKSAESVRRQIERFGLAIIRDFIDPIGNIMAGKSLWEGQRRNKAEIAKS